MADFYLRKKIYYHDTDAGGVVYYANYLKHLEEGRSEYCLNRGIDLTEYAKKGVIFPVVRLEIDYKRPARYGDIIHIHTKTASMGNTSIEFHHVIKARGTLLIKAMIVWACVNKDMRPQRIPPEVKEKLGGA